MATDRDVVAVIDPIDGSTNASMGLPWYATSICAVDASGPLASVVTNQATGVTYTAVRGAGAARDSEPIRPSDCERLADAIVIVNAKPPPTIRWRQYRALGAAALDMCAVADGTADAYIDFGSGLAPWDYLGALLVCREAGATVGSVGNHELVDTSPRTRIRPVAGANQGLVNDLLQTTQQ